MADLFPDAPALAGGHWPRNWHAYDQYQVAHQSNMDALVAEGLVVTDSVTFVESRSGRELLEVNVRGRVKSASSATVTVNKWLEVSVVRGRVNVRTREYDYHAHILLDGRHQNLFRYDNCHGDVVALHKHVFDIAGREVRISAIAPSAMPPLNVVVREAEFCGRFLTGEA